MDVRSRPSDSYSQTRATLPRRRQRFVPAALACVLAVAGCSSSAAKPAGSVTPAGDSALTPTVTLGSTTQPAAATLPAVVDTTLPAETVPATAGVVTAGAKVVVANASTVDGAAGRFTEVLKGKNFVVVKAVNAPTKRDTTKVYYDATDAAALPVATYLASLIGGVTAEVIPLPVPLKDGKMPDGVTVLVLLGSDKADKPLGQVDAPATTTVPGAIATETTIAPPP